SALSMPANPASISSTCQTSTHARVSTSDQPRREQYFFSCRRSFSCIIAPMRQKNRAKPCRPAPFSAFSVLLGRVCLVYQTLGVLRDHQLLVGGDDQHADT